MTDKVQTHIGAIAHAVEDFAETLNVILWNFRFTRTEVDGWNQVFELDRFHILFDHFTNLRAIPFVLFEYGRIMDPRFKGLTHRQVHFSLLSECTRFPYP
ncbi:MAG: hypothetical protein WBY47_01480 [Desulfobacterales bacterium]